MATDIKPSTWFGAGYTVDTSPHIVKLTTNTASSNKILTLLTDANADPTTGDIRYVMWAMVDAILQANAAQTLAGNSSDRMSMSKTTTIDPSGNTRYTYTFSIVIVPSTSIPTE